MLGEVFQQVIQQFFKGKENLEKFLKREQTLEQFLTETCNLSKENFHLVVQFIRRVIEEINHIKSKDDFISTAEKRENFTMEDVIRFFKQKEISEKLKKDTNLQAVVLKNPVKENQIHIICCLYDKNKEKVILEQPPLLNILTDKIDEDLIDQFGDKDMIVLQ